MSIVLDASAVLAILNSEPGADIVSEAVPGARISAVNLSEVVAKLAGGGMPEDAIRSALDGLSLNVVSLNVEAAYLAGLLRPATRSAGLSFGDRACIALGLRLGCAVLTTDRQWEALDLGLEVRLAR